MRSENSGLDTPVLTNDLTKLFSLSIKIHKRNDLGQVNSVVMEQKQQKGLISYSIPNSRFRRQSVTVRVKDGQFFTSIFS